MWHRAPQAPGMESPLPPPPLFKGTGGDWPSFTLRFVTCIYFSCRTIQGMEKSCWLSSPAGLTHTRSWAGGPGELPTTPLRPEGRLDPGSRGRKGSVVSHPTQPLSHPLRMCLGALPAGGPLAGCPILAISPLPARQPHPAALPESRCSEDPLASFLWMQV